MTTAARDGARPTSVRWRILGWAVAAALVGYVLRYNLSVAGPAMMHDLGLSEQQLGVRADLTLAERTRGPVAPGAERLAAA